MAKKAKWLEESTVSELMEIVIEGIGSTDSKVVNKATKAAEEIQERTPDDDGEVTVEEAISAAIEALGVVQSAYEAEAEAMDEDEDDEDDDDDEEDEEEEESEYASMTLKELRAEAKANGIATKGVSKQDLIEALEDLDADEDEEDEDEDEMDYESMSIKDLKAECRERGIKVTKGMRKPDLIEALEADDEE